MAKKALRKLAQSMTIDVACVIYGKGYSWDYVEKLYRGVSQNLTPAIRFHVYTEAHRPVPDYMIKHELVEWPALRNLRRSEWWYKMQLFNTEHHSGQMLYFDLDTVITGNLDWIWRDCDTSGFWAIRDFKYLFKKNSQTLNSSVMWFNTENYSWLYNQFSSNVLGIAQRFHGDQDYITRELAGAVRFFPQQSVQSYRWQLKEGGFEFNTRKYRSPGQATQLGKTSVVVFHGKPKPQNIKDPAVLEHWV